MSETWVGVYHEQAHEDPLDYKNECDLCDDIIDSEIHDGIRCEHGNMIPYIKNAEGYYLTDIECASCGIDYGPAFEPFWLEIQGRTI